MRTKPLLPSQRSLPAEIPVTTPVTTDAFPQPLVSIVLIFFNEAQFITEAIESVLAQSEGGWELLLVDDGSTDESSKIAQTYAQQYGAGNSAESEQSGGIRYLTHPNHENRGMSATRNLGLQQAKGKYITFLDADDIWMPNKLAE